MYYHSLISYKSGFIHPEIPHVRSKEMQKKVTWTYYFCSITSEWYTENINIRAYIAPRSIYNYTVERIYDGLFRKTEIMEKQYIYSAMKYTLLKHIELS